jgi:hypothetical protein
MSVSYNAFSLEPCHKLFLARELKLTVSDWGLLESYFGTLVGDFSIQQNNKGQAIRHTMQTSECLGLKELFAWAWATSRRLDVKVLT